MGTRAVDRRTQTIAFAALALVAFAANSVLARLALQGSTIDPATFSTIRFSAGAATLLLIGRRERPPRPAGGSWATAVILLLYAIPFSFAYTRLTAGTGSLILFGTVQITMVIAAVWYGERPNAREWMGLIAACAGLVYLVLPGLAAPPPWAAASMAVAGLCWGLYSLRGRRSANPIAETSGNFVRTVPLLLAVSAATLAQFQVDVRGALLAIASGALATGLGYVAWYSALRGLTALRAAVVQLAVPVLAATAGVVFLAETISARLVFSAILVLGGIALTIVSRAGAGSLRGSRLAGRVPTARL